jgi:hypothetical protein
MGKDGAKGTARKAALAGGSWRRREIRRSHIPQPRTDASKGGQAFGESPPPAGDPGGGAKADGLV